METVNRSPQPPSMPSCLRAISFYKWISQPDQWLETLTRSVLHLLPSLVDDDRRLIFLICKTQRRRRRRRRQNASDASLLAAISPSIKHWPQHHLVEEEDDDDEKGRFVWAIGSLIERSRGWIPDELLPLCGLSTTLLVRWWRKNLSDSSSSSSKGAKAAEASSSGRCISDMLPWTKKTTAFLQLLTLRIDWS